MVSMKTIFDPGCRQQILARFEKLTPDARPAWGQMTAAQMLAHLADPLKGARGSKTAAAKPSAFSIPIVRTLVIYCLPWPKSAPYGSRVHTSSREHFGDNLTALRATVKEFVASG